MQAGIVKPSSTPDSSDDRLEASFLAPPDDAEAPFGFTDLPAVTGAAESLLLALKRAGVLLPHHVDADGADRYSELDVQAIRSGMALLDAGLPLAALLELAERADAALTQLAEHALDAFLRLVRDPILGAESVDDQDADGATDLVTAYTVMLPATERLVAHQLRRRLIAAAVERLAAREATDTPEP
jgi:hypothetical protein